MKSATIDPDGTVRFVWDDDLRFLADLGPTNVARASHVEPAGMEWTADMGPSEGPVLGPFATRGAALQAERLWLYKNRGI